MSDYIEYITRYERGEDETLIQSIGHGYELIAEQIVRCRDGKHYTDDMEYYHYCGNWCGQVEPDGFCAWGERIKQ